MLKVVGFRVLKCVRPQTDGGNCDFQEVPVVTEEYEVILRQPSKWEGGEDQLWLLHLYETSGQCGSGWCTASWGQAEIRPVQERGPVTHVPSGEIEVDLDPENMPEDFESGPFGWSAVGGDDYYPSGGVSLNKELFRPTGRGHEKPVVWVFCGPSNLGKSTLGQALDRHLQVYETDRAETLQDEIVYAQVIVVGGRHQFTLEDIRGVFNKRELDVEIVEVNFSR